MSKNIKKICCIFFVMIFAFFGYVAISTPFFSIKNLSSTVNGNYSLLEEINKEKPFGKFVYANFDDSLKVSSSKNNKLKVDLKLFNLITLKSFYLNADDTNVYVGGDIVGFSLNGDGVVIIGFGNVETKEGSFNTTENSGLKKGDIILEIDETPVNSVADICKIANKEENKNRQLSLKYRRQNNEYITKIWSKFDVNSEIYKFGLWVKDDISGIGTLTYIREDSNRFGALGHAICESDTKTIYDINKGEMYKCSILGLKKGTKGRAGELKGLFIQNKNNKLGEVDKNSDCGVFGNVTTDFSNREKMLAGGRLYAKPGKAFIRTSIDNGEMKDYEVEIIKTNYQSSSNEKSMVIRVTDKELLKKTGGIIQGMSGSPIIQNNRVIGAITHVFINDPTKGFGIYLDWMINQ